MRDGDYLYLMIMLSACIILLLVNIGCTIAAL